MRTPGYTAPATLSQASAMMARINVGGFGWGVFGVMTNPDCYCVDWIESCSGSVCYYVCIRKVCP
jgi:hypothetical protein